MGSAEEFLRLVNEDNARIAARAAQQAAGVGVDEVQLKRDRERREKWGQLRAREHPGKRPNYVRNVFPYVRPD